MKHILITYAVLALGLITSCNPKEHTQDLPIVPDKNIVPTIDSELTVAELEAVEIYSDVLTYTWDVTIASANGLDKIYVIENGDTLPPLSYKGYFFIESLILNLEREEGEKSKTFKIRVLDNAQNEATFGPFTITTKVRGAIDSTMLCTFGMPGTGTILLEGNAARPVLKANKPSSATFGASVGWQLAPVFANGTHHTLGAEYDSLRYGVITLNSAKNAPLFSKALQFGQAAGDEPALSITQTVDGTAFQKLYTNYILFNKPLPSEIMGAVAGRAGTYDSKGNCISEVDMPIKGKLQLDIFVKEADENSNFDIAQHNKVFIGMANLQRFDKDAQTGQSNGMHATITKVGEWETVTFEQDKDGTYKTWVRNETYDPNSQGAVGCGVHQVDMFVFHPTATRALGTVQTNATFYLRNLRVVPVE